MGKNFPRECYSGHNCIECFNAQFRREFVKQTPVLIWDQYLKNGYTMTQAINEELSYL